MNECRKTPHKSKAAAYRHMKSMSSRKKRVKEGSVYQCDDCGKYHITRSKIT